MLLNHFLLLAASVLVFSPSSAKISEMTQVCGRAGASSRIWRVCNLLHLAPLNLARLSPGAAGQRGPAVLLNIWSFWASVYFKRQGL